MADQATAARSSAGGWTPGPWPWAYTGDGKRITIGDGLVEGPHGYEVAEVYSDDCPQVVAEANARLIAAAPDLADAATALLDRLYRSHLPSEAARCFASLEWQDACEKADALRDALARARGEVL